MGLFHVLNRGVEKRRLFMDDQDHARFVHDLYEFNDKKPAPEFSRRPMWDFVNPTLRERIVDIHGWCLMDNHYHLLLSERVEGGMTKFLRKLNVGYANYFNERYTRSGTLFQGRTKKIRIERDAHFLYILHYIHLNPLDQLQGAKKWREGEVASAQKALEYLDSYRWSSYLDYCGTKNFPSVITTKLFRDVLGDMQSATKSFLEDIELETVRPLLLE